MFQGHREPGDLPETPRTPTGRWGVIVRGTKAEIEAFAAAANSGPRKARTSPFLGAAYGTLETRAAAHEAFGHLATKAPHTCLYGGKPGTCPACAEIAMTPKDPWVTVGRFQFPNEPLGPLPRVAVAQVPHVHYDATEDEGSTL
jgi:hypothetical protein